MRRFAQVFLAVIGICFGGVACGASAPVADETEVGPQRATAVHTPHSSATAIAEDPRTVPSTPATADAMAASTDLGLPVVPSAEPLESNYHPLTSEFGWVVEAGVWTSHGFSVPLTFNVPDEATIVSAGKGRVEFAIGDAYAPRGWLRVVEPIAVSSPGGPIPIDLVSVDNAMTGARILDEADIDGPGTRSRLLDFVIDESPILAPFARPCFHRSDASCLNPFISDGGQVYLEIGATHRLVAQDFSEGRLYVTATATDPTDDAFLDFASRLAASVGVSPSSRHVGWRQVADLGFDETSLPRGKYVASVGPTLVAFDLAQDLDEVAVLDVAPETVGFQISEQGWLWLVNFTGFADPGTGESPRWRPEAAPPTLDEYESALRERLVVNSATSVNIGGLSARAYEVTLDDRHGQSCESFGWFTPGAQCEKVFTTSQYQWYQTSDTADLMYYLPEAGMLIMLTPWPGVAHDALLHEVAPILENLTVVPVS